MMCAKNTCIMRKTDQIEMLTPAGTSPTAGVFQLRLLSGGKKPAFSAP